METYVVVVIRSTSPNVLTEKQDWYISQRTTKATRLLRPAKTQISLRIRAVWLVFADCMCLLQHLGYTKRGAGKPMPYWVDVQAALSLCWLHRSYCITKTRLFKYIVYWKFHLQKLKIFRQKKLWYFSYFCSKHRFGVLIRTEAVLTSTHNLCFDQK